MRVLKGLASTMRSEDSSLSKISKASASSYPLQRPRGIQATAAPARGNPLDERDRYDPVLSCRPTNRARYRRYLDEENSVGGGWQLLLPARISATSYDRIEGWRIRYQVDF